MDTTNKQRKPSEGSWASKVFNASILAKEATEQAQRVDWQLMDSDNNTTDGDTPVPLTYTTQQPLQTLLIGQKSTHNHSEPIRESVQASHGPTINASPATHGNTGPESKLVKNKKRRKATITYGRYSPPYENFALLSTRETQRVEARDQKRTAKLQARTNAEFDKAEEESKYSKSAVDSVLIRKVEARDQKRTAKLQAQVEEEWAQVEENEVVAPNQVPNVKPPTPSESDSYENPNYRLFIQAEEQKKKKRICAALQSCLPPNTTDEQVMRLYNISVSCFQSFKGLDGTEFEKTVQVPPSFDKTIGLQSQVTVNNGLVDTVNNDGREDFVPYLIANGPFKHGEHVPVIISHKVSLRERWKQDEGVAQHSRVFLITLAGLKTSDVSVQKLKKARAHNIHIVVPNLSEFQDNHFVTNKRPLCLTESQMWTQIHSCLSATNLNIVKK
jgi:hypothetical protein